MHTESLFKAGIRDSPKVVLMLKIVTAASVSLFCFCTCTSHKLRTPITDLHADIVLCEKGQYAQA